MLFEEGVDIGFALQIWAFEINVFIKKIMAFLNTPSVHHSIVLFILADFMILLSTPGVWGS